MRHRMLLLFTLGFVAGITAASLVALPWYAYAVLCGASLAGLIFYGRPHPVAIIAVGVMLGALRLIAFAPPGSDVDRYAGPAPVSIAGMISSDPNVAPYRTSFVLTTQSIQTHQGTYAISGKAEILVHGAALLSFHNARYGDPVVVSGMLQPIVPATNPGQFDWRERELHRGVTGELVVQRPYGTRIIRSAAPWTASFDWAARTERNFESVIGGRLPPSESGLLFGILFGDRSKISPELQREFAATGTAHILATAGLHVGILSIALAYLLGILPIPRKAAAVLIIFLLWLFAALAGGRPAVVRAVLAATIFFGGRLFERVPDIPTTLSAAALSILALSPLDLFDSDFQLSFVTVWGLALFLPYWHDYWRPKLKSIDGNRLRKSAAFVVELAGMSIVAQLCSAPLTIYYFSQVSLLSLPVNLLVVPLLFILIPCAVALLLVAAVFPAAIAAGSAYVLHPLLWSILHVVRWFERLPFCSAAIAEPPPFAIFLIYAVAYSFALQRGAKPAPLSGSLV